MRLIRNLTISWEMNFYVVDFSVYFSIESNSPKNIFCIINLVHLQVYRVEKVGKYLLSLAKKSIFKFFVNENLIFT
jgi:hypothetical protein